MRVIDGAIHNISVQTLRIFGTGRDSHKSSNGVHDK